jgi:polysaccharide biosynthesis/export protein
MFFVPSMQLDVKSSKLMIEVKVINRLTRVRYAAGCGSAPSRKMTWWLSCLLLFASFAHAGDYKIGAEDLLRVDVFDHPELSVQARVSASGNMTLPLVGPIAVKGMTARELEQSLVTRLNDGGFVRKPQVTVLVVEYLSQKVSVLGQVAKPGQYSLTTSNTVRDLIAQAGGLNNGIVAVNGIAGDDGTLTRADGTRTTIDLHAMFEGDPAQNPTVAAGDTVYIPRANVFYVAGEVQRPGQYKLERNMTVYQAIAAGGGLTPKGSNHWMKIRRRSASGVVESVSAKGSDLLKPDDVLSVNQKWF